MIQVGGVEAQSVRNSWHHGTKQVSYDESV